MLAFAPLNSNLIKFVQYDEFCKLLTVEVAPTNSASGNLYQFSGVTRYRYDALKRSKSKGSYFATNIRGKYPTRKVNKVITGATPTEVPVVLVSFKK